jgi:hypothetical protein
MDGDKREEAGRDDPPRQTYIPKPPSKEEVDQVSREQGMIADDWTGEPPGGERAQNAGEAGATEQRPPPDAGDGKA